MVYNTPKMYLEFWGDEIVSKKKMVLESLKVVMYSNVLCMKLGATC